LLKRTTVVVLLMLKELGEQLQDQDQDAIASGEDIVDAIATATDVVSNVANVLANSPVRQPRRRPQPALARRPRQRPDPSPEPVNRTRKRRAAGDVGEMDLGPRKLWSRK
jgi:hypothetical protein